VVMPPTARFSGERYRLPLWLAQNPRWVQVYRSPAAAVFRRRDLHAPGQ